MPLCISSSCREWGAVHSGPGEVWGELCLQRRSWPGFSFPQVLCIHQRAHSTLQKPGERMGVYCGLDGVRREGTQVSWDIGRLSTGPFVVYLFWASVLSNTYSQLKCSPSGPQRPQHSGDFPLTWPNDICNTTKYLLDPIQHNPFLGFLGKPRLCWKNLTPSCEVSGCPQAACQRTHSRSCRVCISFISAADIKDTWAAASLGSEDVISWSICRRFRLNVQHYTKAGLNRDSKLGSHLSYEGSFLTVPTSKVSLKKWIYEAASSCRSILSTITFQLSSHLPAVSKHEQHHHLSSGQPAERRSEGRQRGKAAKQHVSWAGSSVLRDEFILVLTSKKGCTQEKTVGHISRWQRWPRKSLCWSLKNV